MSAQGLEAIDHTVQVTHEWVNELRERLGWVSSRDALRLLRATLVQVRDHLGTEEVAQLSAQMPLLIRGMYFEGWQPKHTPVRDRSPEHFVEAISARLSDSHEWGGVQDIVVVFKLLNNRISKGEIDDVKANLPRAIRDLWPD